jgi:signal transduction histidine kinase
MLGIVFAFLAASFSFFLSLTVYRARPGSFLNRTLAGAFLFFALWIMGSYSHLLLAEPSPYFVTKMYRICYFLVVLATGFFFLFALGFLKGGHPGKRKTLVLEVLILALAALNLTGLTLRKATYHQGIYSQVNGPLYAVFVLTEAALGGGALLCLELKRRRSLGTDRARATYILAGFALYIPLAILLALVLPGMMERDVTTDYAYWLTVLPLGATAYAILRHRLLDVRLALRYTFTYLAALVVFGLPLLAFYLAFSYLWRYDPRVYAALSASILALAVALTPAALRWSSRLASRLFFSGLYDEVELLHRASEAVMLRGDVRRGVAEASALVCERLGLRELVAVVPDFMTEGRGTWLMGAHREGQGTRSFVEVTTEDSPLYQFREETLLLEDREACPEGSREGAARAALAARGLVAAIPLRGPGGVQGTLLVGEKPNRLALDPLDLGFLEDFARRIGLFVENHLLSLRLLARVEELTRARDRLEESDRFKSDIINLTSHEFRTPLTVLQGFTRTMVERFDELREEQKKEFLGYMEKACRRLERLVDEFHTVSLLKGGKLSPSPGWCPLSTILEEAVNGLDGSGGGRVEVELPDSGVEVVTDRRLLVIVLVHLLENALRYSEPGTPVLLRGEREKGGVTITVRDYGEGIPAEVAERIFEPFMRLEEVDKHGEGAGLGLYIVRLAAEILGMEVQVDSRPGEGTTFRLHIPGTFIPEGHPQSSAARDARSASKPPSGISRG